MMKFFKKALLGAAVATALATSAQAGMVTVAGVTWDPDSPLDFSSQSVNMRQFIDTTTGVLSGFGIFTVFNGLGAAQFCASGCELTFQFGGFTPTAGTIVPGAGVVATYSGGFVNVFSGAFEIANPFNYNALTFANTGNGTLFLGLENTQNFVGTNTGNTLLSGLGFLDVKAGAAGGAARNNFDTNTQLNGADFGFTTSLSFLHTPGNVADVSGTGNFVGNSVPEPESLALVGLGLLGLAAVRRRKAVK